MIAEPPVFVGAVKLTVALPLLTVALIPVGVPGAMAAGVTEDDALEVAEGDLPVALVVKEREHLRDLLLAVAVAHAPRHDLDEAVERPAQRHQARPLVLEHLPDGPILELRVPGPLGVGDALGFQPGVQLNAWLEAQCIAYAKRTRHPEFKDRTIWEVFQDERPSLMALRGPFDGFVEIMTGRMGDRDSKEEIAKVFALFDHEGNGKISFRDLKRVVLGNASGHRARHADRN